MEAGEYELTCGMCFVARRLEVVAVAGLLCTSWCVLGGADFFWAMARNGSSRSILGQKRVGRSMKAANTEFGLT